MSRITDTLIYEKRRFLINELGLYDIYVHDNISYKRDAVYSGIKEDFYIGSDFDITFKFQNKAEIGILMDTLQDLYLIKSVIPNTSSEVETIVCLLNQIKELKEEIARLKDEQSKDC